MTNEITYCVRDTLSKVWAEGKIAVSPDAGIENILSTTGLLTRLASASTDPVTETPGGSTSDSLSVKLLSSILFHRVIAHNSPVSVLTEESNGIFTNYIKYFDDIVKNWDSVNDSAAGLPRLRAIYNRVLSQNSGIITDPVWAFNHGTLSEYGRPEQERKNYAFYEGYSRLHFDMENPVYSTGTHTGAGIMFRVSDNIELYKANLADTFNMFDSAIIDGAVARRLIVTAKDTILDKVNSDGLWVKGVTPAANSNIKDQIWYSGVSALRLPMRNMLSSGVKIDTAFNLPGGEIKGYCDVAGKIVGGGENSIVKTIPIITNENELKTEVSECENGTILIHGGKRIVRYNPEFINNGDIKFTLNGDSITRNKVKFDTNGNDATINDTALFSKLGILTLVYLGTTIVYADIRNLSSKHLCLKDADLNGKYEVLTDGLSVIEVNIETNSDNWICPNNPEECPVDVVWTNNVKVYKNNDVTDDNNLIWPPMDKKEQSSGSLRYKNWNEFKTEVLQKISKLFVVCKNSGESKISIVPAIEEHNGSQLLGEKIVVQIPDVKIKDSKGNVLTNEDKLFSPKSDGPAIIDVVGYNSEDDFIEKIEFKIRYDVTNSDHVTFYGSEQVVRTFSSSYTGPQTSYNFTWDGRSYCDNRILLKGKYSVSAEIKTKKSKNVIINKFINIAAPKIVRMGFNYPINQEIVNSFISRNNGGGIDWTAVDFLDEERNENFEWLMEYSTAISFCDKCEEYDQKRIASAFKKDKFTLLDDVEENAALYNFMAHHTIYGVTGQLLFGGGKKLQAYCDGSSAPGYCAGKIYCMDYKCDGAERGNNLDDVLLAVAAGCRTDVGFSSTVNSLIEHGADCAIGTKIQVWVPILVFWNVYFWRYLNEGSTINDAAEIAFETSMSRLLQFTTYGTIEALKTALGEAAVGVDTYDNTISIEENPSNAGIKNETIFPARYGSKN